MARKNCLSRHAHHPVRNVLFYRKRICFACGSLDVRYYSTVVPLLLWFCRTLATLSFSRLTDHTPSYPTRFGVVPSVTSPMLLRNRSQSSWWLRLQISDGQLRYLRAHPGRTAVRHWFPRHTRARPALAVAAGQRHPHGASARPCACAGSVHGPQAAGGAHHVVVPARVDRVHAAVPHYWVDVNARARATLQRHGAVQPTHELARDRNAHGCYVSFLVIVTSTYE